MLDIFDFMFMVSQAVCLVNKRPVAFSDALRESAVGANLPSPITPEMLLRGHDLVTLNILPCQSVDVDPDWSPDLDRDAHIKQSFSHLNQNRKAMYELYQQEFLADLTRQATNTPNRYAQVKHDKLQINDIVLLKEMHLKSVNFPMGRVIATVENSMGEVTDATVLKGNGERVRRHVRSLVLLLREPEATLSDGIATAEPTVTVPEQTVGKLAQRSVAKRAAAARCGKHLSDLATANLI